ncbi:uncharacterized protein LOC107045100, partial [Diachasma alloeum]|uniref:uncharacterized protein LOC107045100 n=1 Tax=Diachasma alloeum TaxID=454923 RepID=UPI000738419D
DHQQPQDDGDGVNLRRPPVSAPNIQQLIQQQVLEQLRNIGFPPSDPAAEGARVAPQPAVPGRRVPPADGDPLQSEIPPARGAIPVPEGQPEDVPERAVMREILQELQLQREAREREARERVEREIEAREREEAERKKKEKKRGRKYWGGGDRYPGYAGGRRGGGRGGGGYGGRYGDRGCPPKPAGKLVARFHM